MTTSRLGILLAVLLGGLSTIFLLPKSASSQPVGVELELPKVVGGMWFGSDEKVSDGERATLGYETEFSRKRYSNARGDMILASVVLAGHDMNTSIHRPEWCLPAQGWTIAGSTQKAIRLPDRGTLSATRLYNSRIIPDRDGKPIIGPDGQPVRVWNLDYYWFVGCDRTTPSHISRNWIDIGDRLRKGYNQRWAFVTVAANISSNLRREGLNEAQTDAMIQDFITKLVPYTHKDAVKFD